MVPSDGDSYFTDSQAPRAAVEKRASQFRRQQFEDTRNEQRGSPHYSPLSDDTEANLTFGDRFFYRVENAVATNANVRFQMLAFISAVSVLVLGLIWSRIRENNADANPNTSDDLGAIFMTFQVLVTGGYDATVIELSERVLFAIMILVGVTLISILIGLITDSVNNYMASLTAGTTKVALSGHTLILGWNQSSTRVICQLAFLRRIYLKQNESTLARRLFPWLRVRPSTLVARAPIVIMNMLDKTMLEDSVRAAFSERGITGGRTLVGRDVVFRYGDPTLSHDLVRVRAQAAHAVCIQMNDVDVSEARERPRGADNSATIRTVLALRSVLYSQDSEGSFPPGLRVVCQLSKPCSFLDATSFHSPDGHKVLWPQDIAVFVNAMLFYCATKPGLSRVYISILNLKDTSIRTRRASELRAGPNYEKGWMVGRSVQAAVEECMWGNAILIGCDDARQGEFDTKNDTDGYNAPGSAGILGDPDRKILESDWMVRFALILTPSPPALVWVCSPPPPILRSL